MRSKCREALIGLLVELRPSWGADGIRKALEDPSLSQISEGKISLIAVKAALDPTHRTPALIPLTGDHWLEVGAPSPGPKPYSQPTRLSDSEREAAQIAAAAAFSELERKREAARAEVAERQRLHDEKAAK